MFCAARSLAAWLADSPEPLPDTGMLREPLEEPPPAFALLFLLSDADCAFLVPLRIAALRPAALDAAVLFPIYVVNYTI